MAKIYISSTFTDLKEHRARVRELLAKTPHDMVSMEDYNASRQRPLSKCTQDVENCDIYVGLIAWRYGYIPDTDNPDNISITEAEYRTAIKTGKEIIILHVPDQAPWPPNMMDAQTDAGPDRINTLRSQMATNHTIGFFTTPDELAAHLAPAIEEAAKNIAPEELPPELLENLAMRFGHDNPDAPKEELTAFLKDKAREYHDMEARLKAMAKAEGRIANLLGAAQDALANGDFAEADARLKDAEDVQLTEHTLVQVRKQVDLRVERGQAALLSGDQNRAADLFTEAGKMLLPFDKDEGAKKLRELADRLYYHALRYGGDGLALSADIYREILTIWTHETSAQNWAMVQNDLAVALRNQGTRAGGEDGLKLLNQAVTAYRAALMVRTKDAHPVDWAMTQNNLGNTLQEQGTRAAGKDGLKLLADSVTAFRAALKVYTKDAHPVQWATTQNNLGITLQEQGTRADGEDGLKLLAEAVTAFRAALEVYTFDAHPVYWAMAQANLAIVEKSWAEHEACDDSKPHLEAALEYVDASLTVFDPLHMPYDHGTATELREEIISALTST